MQHTKKMHTMAIEAMGKAYAPYSNFFVGACILSENNNLYTGANIENASYPQGWCAEASCISAMVMAGDKKIKEILVIGGLKNTPIIDLCTPCGGCRQKIREFADENCLIHIASENAILKTFTLAELLPYSFGPSNLQ
jgi:cytidine deaminase